MPVFVPVFVSARHQRFSFFSAFLAVFRCFTEEIFGVIGWVDRRPAVFMLCISRSKEVWRYF